MRTIARVLAATSAVLAITAAITAVILLVSSVGTITTAWVETIRNTDAPTTTETIQAERTDSTVNSLSPDTMANVGIALILLASALAAAYRFHLFRESAPHITISQEVSTQRVSPGYLLVNVNAHLRNTSNVRVTPANAICWVAQTAPLTDEQVESIYAEGIAQNVDPDTQRFPWWELDRDEIRWPNAELTVDPNEGVTITFQLIIAAAVTGISVATGIYKRLGDDDGWFYQATHAVPEMKPEL